MLYHSPCFLSFIYKWHVPKILFYAKQENKNDDKFSSTKDAVQFIEIHKKKSLLFFSLLQCSVDQSLQSFNLYLGKKKKNLKQLKFHAFWNYAHLFGVLNTPLLITCQAITILYFFFSFFLLSAFSLVGGGSYILFSRWGFHLHSSCRVYIS